MSQNERGSRVDAERLLTGIITAIRPAWSAICMPAAPLFAFFCLRIFAFRFDKRHQNWLLLLSGILCGLGIYALDQTLYGLGISGGGYLRITLITAAFTIAGALILYRGDRALIALTALLLYNIFSATRFVFLGLITGSLPGLKPFVAIDVAILPTVPVCVGVYLFISRVQKKAVSGFTPPESVLWFAVSAVTMVIMCVQPGVSSFGWPLIAMALNVIFTSGAIYCLIFLYSRQKFIATEQEKVLSNMEKYEGYIEQMQELDAHMSALRHELKNYIFYIDQLLERQDYAALKEYVDGLKGRDLDAARVVATGNSVIDAIVNQKCAYAQSLGIRAEAAVLLPEPLLIDELSLCSVLGNFLNNAIEASAGVKDAFLRLHIHPHKDYLVISVKNSVARDVIKENPHLLTTKKDAENHGVGLKVVEQIADWYEGTLQCRMEGPHTFEASILMKNMHSSIHRKN